MSRGLLLRLVSALGALTAGVAGQAAASSVASVAWAMLAGLGVSFMLYPRAVAFLVGVLGVAGTVWAFGDGLPVAGVGFLVAVAGALVLAIAGTGSPSRRHPSSETHVDMWRAMDAGDDPTG